MDMKAWRCYIVLVCLCVAATLPAQTSYTVSGKVVDAANQAPLAFSAVMLKGSFTSTETNAAGEFTITVNDKNHTLIIFQYGYDTKEQMVSAAEQKDLLISLQAKAYNLTEIVVRDKRTDTLQAGNHTEYLSFEFYDNFLVALVNKGRRYNMVQLLDESGKVIREYKAPEGVHALFKDCLGNVQLLSADSSYQFYYNYEMIELLKPYSLELFARTLRPCQCISGDTYYFKEVTYKNLKNTYYMINRRDLQKKMLFTQVENTDAITAFNTDYDLNYFLGERRKGFSYGMSVEEMKLRIDELRNDLPLTTEYLFKLNPIKSDIVKLDSSLLVVDYTHRLLYKHHASGALLKTDSLSLKGVSPFVVQDADLQKLYFVKESNGQMSLHEYKNRFANSKALIIEGYRFIRNVRCRNGTLYFLNRNSAVDNVTKIFTYRL
jgi:hypothetical protein